MDDGGRKHKKILFASENYQFGEGVRDVFAEHGFEVFLARDGEEVQQVYSQHIPEVIFLDYPVPTISSHDLLARIRKKDQDVGIVFLVSMDREETAVEALEEGASDYLIKPYSMTSLIHAANRILRDRENREEKTRLKNRGDGYKDCLITISDTLGEAVIIIDAKGKIQFMNTMALRLWGSLKDMKNKPVDVLIPDPGVELFEDIRNAYAKGKEHFQGEYTFRKVEGTIFSGLLTAARLKSERYAGGIVLVVRDLTDIEIMRRQVISVEKLASLGKVVEGVAHEIRNSLTSLGGFSRRLSKSLDPDSAQRMYGDYIIEDVKRLETMIMDIEDYVNYTKIHRPHFKITNIEEVIDDALIKNFGSGRFSGISYEVNMPGDLEEIVADPVYLVEAFWHLFENACESMDARGHLVVNVGLHPHYLIVDVIDTGKGIPGDEIKDIFNPFYTSKVRGAGLGLSKVYLIIEEHGGFISVNSSVNKGTRMRVFLSRKKTLAGVAPTKT
ncbi:MAG: ATP-binding protein [Desulfomonilia bacterium]|nr:ATP-binding protein [Desulfomonilia bacterium]